MEKLEKLLNDYGIVSEHIYCGLVVEPFIKEAHAPGNPLFFKKFVFVLKLKDEYRKISPKEEDFFIGKQFRGMALGAPTTAGLISSILLDYTEESFDEWCDNFGLSRDSRRAKKSYKQCKRYGARLKAFINNDDIFNKLVEAAQEY